MFELSGRPPGLADEYVAQVTREFAAGDGVLFASSPLDEFIEEKKRDSLTGGVDDVTGFQGELVEAAMKRAKDISRWEEGSSIQTASSEKIELISYKTPPHLVINPEALGGIHVQPAERYKLDIVSEDIMAEAASLLPRSIDAYPYQQGYANDQVEVDGLGTVEVRMSDSEGIFKAISEVRIGDFRIWNGRQTGLEYNNELLDFSNPSEIDIGSAGVKIRLGGDGSDIQVEKDGHKVVFGGTGHSSESDRTLLEDEVIRWLAENVLFPLCNAEKPVEQITTPPEVKPFPYEKIGPLLAFIEMRDAERVRRIRDNPESAYPEERYAIEPGWRLLPFGTARDIPEEAQLGFIYAMPAEVTWDTDLASIDQIGKEYRRTDALLGKNHGFAQIIPNSAEDMYVVDWKRGATDEGQDEGYAAVARTMVPVTEYDGSYEEPIILIGRRLALHEITALYPAPERD